MATKHCPTLIALLLALIHSPQARAFDAFLDGSAVPEAPWQTFLDGEEDQRGETLIVEFLDPVGQTNNQALRLNSGTGANEYFVGAFPLDEMVGAARFRLVDFSATGKENLLCVTTRSRHLAPAPSLTLVDGRFKLWSYVLANAEILDLGAAETNNFHTIYLYARSDGLVKLWWDGKLLFDEIAPQVNPYDAYFEWGSGSWQFDATDTIDFDWVGYGTAADLPLSVRSVPAHGAIFQEANAGLKFTVVSQPGLAPGVAASGIGLMVNGADRTSELTITGTDQNREVSFSGLSPDKAYRVVLRSTDLNGMISNYPIAFDTFRTNYLTIEAEDFNFEGGKFLDTVVLASAAGQDNYIDRLGVEGVDHHELSTESGNAPHLYRAESLVATERNKDTPRPQYLAAQATDENVADFNVANIEVGEWLNYTRTVPPGRYNIYARLAGGEIGTNYVASLGQVSNPTSANQTVSPLGVFRGGPGQGLQNYEFVPLTDAQGNLVTVELSGTQTLRLTSTEGVYSANFLMLVPAAASAPSLGISRAQGEVVLTWDAPGAALQTTDRLGGAWTVVPNATSPFRAGTSDTARFYRLSQ